MLVSMKNKNEKSKTRFQYLTLDATVKHSDAKKCSLQHVRSQLLTVI